MSEQRVVELEALLWSVAASVRGYRSYGGDRCDCPDNRTAKQVAKGRGRACRGHETETQRLLRDGGFDPAATGTAFWRSRLAEARDECRSHVSSYSQIASLIDHLVDELVGPRRGLCRFGERAS